MYIKFMVKFESMYLCKCSRCMSMFTRSRCAACANAALFPLSPSEKRINICIREIRTSLIEVNKEYTVISGRVIEMDGA